LTSESFLFTGFAGSYFLHRRNGYFQKNIAIIGPFLLLIMLAGFSYSMIKGKRIVAMMPILKVSN